MVIAAAAVEVVAAAKAIEMIPALAAIEVVAAGATLQGIVMPGPPQALDAVIGVTGRLTGVSIWLDQAGEHAIALAIVRRIPVHRKVEVGPTLQFVSSITAVQGVLTG